jgi:uncharacterized protein YndB with AHSA1/START domain
MAQAELRLTRVIRAPVEEVFDAWTNPAVMVDWFFGGEHWSVDVQNDLRVGGAFSLAMRSDDGEVFPHQGVYREISPPTRLVFTWTSHLVTDTLVTVELSDLGDGTTHLTLVHEGLVDAEMRQSHAEGWGTGLANLENAVTRPA